MIAFHTYDLSTVVLLATLLVAVVTDLRCHKIPNWLTLGLFVSGLSLQLYFLGTDGLQSGLAGAGMGLVVFLPFYILGGMGAGDVKMMAAVGTLLGYKAVALAAAFSLLLAGVYALMLVTLKREWSAVILRYVVSVKTRSYVPSEENSVTSQRFPFALAIAAGSVTVLAMESQLDFYYLRTELSYQLQAWGASL